VNHTFCRSLLPLEYTRLTTSDEIRFHVIRMEYGLPHSSLNTSVKQFSCKLHKNRKIGMTKIFPSKSEYNDIILQVNLHAFHV
jgi:hypothetical protein